MRAPPRSKDVPRALLHVLFGLAHCSALEGVRPPPPPSPSDPPTITHIAPRREHEPEVVLVDWFDRAHPRQHGFAGSPGNAFLPSPEGPRLGWLFHEVKNLADGSRLAKDDAGATLHVGRDTRTLAPCPFGYLTEVAPSGTRFVSMEEDQIVLRRLPDCTEIARAAATNGRPFFDGEHRLLVDDGRRVDVRELPSLAVRASFRGELQDRAPGRALVVQVGGAHSRLRVVDVAAGKAIVDVLTPLHLHRRSGWGQPLGSLTHWDAKLDASGSRVLLADVSFRELDVATRPARFRTVGAVKPQPDLEWGVPHIRVSADGAHVCFSRMGRKYAVALASGRSVDDLRPIFVGERGCLLVRPPALHGMTAMDDSEVTVLHTTAAAPPDHAWAALLYEGDEARTDPTSKRGVPLRLIVLDPTRGVLLADVPLGRHLPAEYRSIELTASGPSEVLVKASGSGLEFGGRIDVRAGTLTPLPRRAHPSFSEILARASVPKHRARWKDLRCGIGHCTFEGGPSLPTNHFLDWATAGDGATALLYGLEGQPYVDVFTTDESPRRIARLFAAGPAGVVALLEGGGFDIVGDAGTNVLCRRGRELLVRGACRARFHVKNGLRRALTGKVDWLEPQP